MKHNYNYPRLCIRAFALSALLLSASLCGLQASDPGLQVFDATRCNIGAITLTATVASGFDENKIYWYTQPFYGEPIATGPELYIGELQNTLTFYVDYITPEGCGVCDRLQVRAIYLAPIAETNIFYEATSFCNTVNQPYIPTIVGLQQGTFSVNPTSTLLQNTATGAINPNGITPGSYTITYTPDDITGCNSDPVSIMVTISALPQQPVISFAAGAYCGSAGAVNITRTGATGGNYSASPSGLTMDPGTGQVNTAASQEGNYAIQYFIMAAGGCPPLTATTTLSINTVSVGGTAIALLSEISSGGNTTISLTGYNGSIQWQSSTMGASGTFSNITGANEPILETGALTETTWYRAEVTNGICAPAYSTVAQVTVSAASVGGTAAADPLVICDGSFTTLSLTGYVGVIQWQSNETGAFGDIPGATSATFQTAVLNISTPNTDRIVSFRARVVEGLSTPAFSNEIAVAVKPPSVAGLAIGEDICSGSDGTVHVFDNLGSIQWQSSITEEGTYTDIVGAVSGSYTATAMTTTTWYRAKITNTPCTEAYTNVVAIQVSQPTIAGTVTVEPTEVCPGGTATLTLTGYTGSIYWEYNAPGSTDWTYSGGTNTFETIPLTLTGTYTFRARVTSGQCVELLSNEVTIAVVENPVLSQPDDISLCKGGSIALTSTLTGGTGTYHYQWQYAETSNGTYVNIETVSHSGIIYTPNAANLTIAGDGNEITGDKFYKLLISSDIPDCANCEAQTDVITVTTVEQPGYANYSFPATNITYGEAVTFGVDISGGLGGTLSWLRAATSGGTVTTVTSPDVPPAGTWYYRPVYVATGTGCTLADGTETTVTVGQQTLTITANDVLIGYGEEIPPFTDAIVGFITGEDEADLTGTLTFTGTATTASSSVPGTYTITTTGYTSSNYNIIFVDGTLTIAEIIVEEENGPAKSGNNIQTPYNSLKSAFDAIVAGEYQGVVTVKIYKGTAEIPAAILNLNGVTGVTRVDLLPINAVEITGGVTFEGSSAP